MGWLWNAEVRPLRSFLKQLFMKHLVLGLLVGAGLLLLDGATASYTLADLTAPSLAAAAVTGVASYGLESIRRQ